MTSQEPIADMENTQVDDREEIATIAAALMENSGLDNREEIAAIAAAVMEHSQIDEREEIAAVVSAIAESIHDKEYPRDHDHDQDKKKIRTTLSSQWAFPYFDFDAFKKDKEGHIAECRANKIPSQLCEDVAMYDEIAYATKIAEEYQDHFDTQPGYKTYLADLGEYYAASEDEKKKEIARKFHKKYPAAKVEIFGEDQPIHITHPFVAQYYRSQEGVSFLDPSTFGSNIYGKKILQGNSNLLKKIAHPELINNTQIASAYLASLWACGNNPLGTDDPRCAFSTIYSELVDYNLSKSSTYTAPKKTNVGTKTDVSILGMPIRPRLKLRPPPPILCDASQSLENPTPSVPTPSVPTPSVPTPSVPTPSVPTPSVPTPSVPTLSVPTPSIPAKSAAVQPATNSAMRREETRMLARLRYAPVLTKGFSTGSSVKFLIPAPGYGSGIVW